VLLATVACASALATAPAALAHATLTDTSPASGAVLPRAPAHVVLRFDETVTTVVGSLRVYDGQARRVDTGNVTKPTDRSVAVALPERLPDDTYTVAWRVLSADSHPVRGAYVFSVGGPLGVGVADRVIDAELGSPSVEWALRLARFASLALVLGCVGGVVVLGLVAPPGARVVPLWLALAAAGVALALAAVASIVLTGVAAAGFGLGSVFRWELARDVLETGFGQAWLARALLGLALATLAVVAIRRPARAVLPVAMLLAAGIAFTPALSGHARVEGPIAVAQDTVHVGAAGVWVGGLSFLALLLVVAGGDRWSLAATSVPRFSTLAILAVIALVASGILGGLLQVGSWDGLWETTYGRLLLAKVAVLVPLLALGAYNRRVSVPGLRRLDSGSPIRRRFTRVAATELALMALIVGVTTALVAEPPAKAHADAAEVVSRDGRIGPYSYTLTVEPARAGANEIHVYLLDSTGGLAPVDEITLAGTLPALDLGPLALAATPAGPGHAIATAAELPLPGDWQLRLDVREGEFDVWSTTIPVPIGKDS
jgi:copper transport protein